MDTKHLPKTNEANSSLEPDQPSELRHHSDMASRPPEPVVAHLGHRHSHHHHDLAHAHRHHTRFQGVLLVLVILSLIFSSVAAIFSIISFVKQGGFNSTSSSSSIDTDRYYSGGNSAQFEDSTIASVVDQVSPAVVSILTETQVRNYFFGQNQTSTGAGTGMIVTEDGYIITNSHVISDADRVTVVTDSGDTYEDVEVVGVDPLNDVAYLKIADVSGLPTVTLGDSKSIATGQPVLAIGNALGVYQNSITQGIISGTGRTVTATDSTGSSSETLTDMIQTDAAINPGNSGGPLVNAAGEVIGINTAVSTSAQSLGFAIPISSVKGMLTNIIENSLAERAYVGVSYIAITPEVAKEYDLPVSSGAYVYGSSNPVVTGGPADEAGIKKGDIITAVNNVAVGSAGSISTLIGEYAVGETVQLSVIRDGSEYTVDVTLAAYPG